MEALTINILLQLMDGTKISKSLKIFLSYFLKSKQNLASIHLLSSEKPGQIVLYPKGLNRGEL